MQKATRQHTKDHNSRLVLKTIFDGREVSRADVARLTGLTRPTVSAIVTELLESDLVVELGYGPSAGGKPPTMLTVNESGRKMLAIDLSGDEFRAARFNLKGEIEDRAGIPATGLRGDDVVESIVRLLEPLMPPSTPLLGLGIATPGLVDPQSGVVLRAVNLGWVNLPLRDLLEAHFDVPVHIANDSHMTALAEYTFGKPLSTGNLIVIRVGRGIGSGIILNGSPFYGDGFGAGEIGHVVVDPSGRVCTCGNRGCLETTSSITAILQRVSHLKRDRDPRREQVTISWPELVSAALDHDPDAVEIVVRAGCHLGQTVAHLVAAYNIRNVVLTGRIADLGDLLLDAVISEMHQRVLPALATRTRVHYTSLVKHQPGDIVMLGCSALLLHRELGVI